MRSTINTARFQKKVDDKVFAYLSKLAQFVENEAVNNTTILKIFDTGHLQSSITQEPFRSEMRIKVGANIGYAMANEFGTWASREPSFSDLHTGMKPRPYLRPAFDLMIENLKGKAKRK
jgi:HK97 gp10 family phage protein